MSTVRRLYDWMFSVPPAGRSRWAIILWWEVRRIPYNLIVGTLGTCSIFLLYFFSANEPVRNGEDIVEPVMLLVAPLLFNAGYTLGWIVEGFAPSAFLNSFPGERQKIGPQFLWFGLQLSLLVIALPTLWWAGLWLLRLVGFRQN